MEAIGHAGTCLGKQCEHKFYFVILGSLTLFCHCNTSVTLVALDGIVTLLTLTLQVEEISHK